MEIKYKKLTIENFKGVRDRRTVEFNEGLTQILGANHTGKTTTADAVQWVLFGKNCDGDAVFGISPRDENNEIVPNLDNRVVLTMTVDGRVITLEKVRKEVHTKKRGSEEETVSYQNNYFINGDKYSERDYKTAVDEICKESLFKALSNPLYFPALKGDVQRTLLTKMIAEPSLEDIAGGNSTFGKVLESMTGTDMKRHREHLAYRIKEVKKELQDIPSRISEQAGELSALEGRGTDFEALAREIAHIEEEIEECNNELADSSKVINRDYEIRSHARKEINTLKAELGRMEINCERNNAEKKRVHRQAVRTAEAALDNEERKLQKIKRDISDAEQELQRIEREADTFRTRWKEVEAMTFAWDSSRETCVTCGQRLPEGDIERMRAEAEERFNANKAQQQDDLDLTAAGLKRRKMAAEEQLRKAHIRKEEAQQTRDRAEEIYEGEKAMVVELEDCKADSKYQQIEVEIKRRTAELEESGCAATRTAEDAAREIHARLAELNKKRDERRDLLGLRKIIEGKRNRLAELETMQRNLNQQLTQLEGEDYAAEQLMMEYISEVEKRVNRLFDEVRFRMFKRLLNGNVEPICECTYHGTSYSDLSTSEKINAGIEIVNAMCEYNGTWVPCFIDNAESVNDVTPMKSQQVLLIVSRDRELTVIRG